MISRGVMVSLAVTAIVAIGLFLFFRNRMTKIEQKLNLMFQLIQEHNTAQELARAQMMAQQRKRMPGPPPTGAQRGGDSPPGRESELIEISDDDAARSSGESTDSEEVSDTEPPAKLAISETKGDFSLGELKGINLEISGAEVADKSTLDLDEVSDLEELATEEMPKPAVAAEEAAPTKEAVVKTVKMATVDLASLRVTELRDRCEEKGLKGYKSLRKPALIELLLDQE
jgi:hypothetical protein